MTDPTELATPQGGVEAPSGTGGEEVPTPAPAVPVPAEGQPAPAVPEKPTTAPVEEPPTAERPVNLTDYPEFRRWQSEQDRQNAERDRQMATLQQEADRWRTQVETADMTDEEKTKWERDRYKRERDELYEYQERQYRWTQHLEKLRHQIATENQIPLEALSVAGGEAGMMKQAVDYVRRLGTPSAPRRAATPAPAAPAHGASAGSPGLWEQYQAATPSEKRDMRKKSGRRLWDEAGSKTE